MEISWDFINGGVNIKPGVWNVWNNQQTKEVMSKSCGNPPWICRPCHNFGNSIPCPKCVSRSSWSSRLTVWEGWVAFLILIFILDLPGTSPRARIILVMVTMFGSYVILPRHLVKSQYYASHTPIAQTPMARLRLVSRCSLLSHSHRRPENFGTTEANWTQLRWSGVSSHTSRRLSLCRHVGFMIIYFNVLYTQFYIIEKYLLTVIRINIFYKLGQVDL